MAISILYHKFALILRLSGVELFTERIPELPSIGPPSDNLFHLETITHKTIIRLLGVTVSLTALFSFNNKENYTPNPNNPPSQDLPQEAFDITVCEEDPEVEADSTYRFFAKLRGGASGISLSGNLPERKVIGGLNLFFYDIIEPRKEIKAC